MAAFSTSSLKMPVSLYQRCVLLVPLGQEQAAHAYEKAFTLCAYPVVGQDFFSCLTAPVPELSISQRVSQKDSQAASVPVVETPQVQTLLLVEDNLINQVVARAIIEKSTLPFSLKIANHGQEALAILEAHSEEICLILMDLQMPVMDGFETLKQIRKQKRWADLPVIAVTAQALQGDREQCLAVGFNDYLGKPFVPEQLETLLKTYL